MTGFRPSCDTLPDAVGVAGFFHAATDTGERGDTPEGARDGRQ